MITAKYNIVHDPEPGYRKGAPSEITRLLYACIPEGIVSGFLIAAIAAAIAYLWWGREAPTLVAEVLIVLVGWIGGFCLGFVGGLICAFCEKE